MTLTDTGPLVAMIDAEDAHHARTLAALAAVRWPLVTTEACMTETLYLLHSIAGWTGQNAIWQFVADNSLQILTPPADAPLRARAYMDRYRDLPCDYADATLLIAAEENDFRRIFTIDRHFYAYRFSNGSVLEVIHI